MAVTTISRLNLVVDNKLKEILFLEIADNFKKILQDLDMYI